MKPTENLLYVIAALAAFALVPDFQSYWIYLLSGILAIAALDLLVSWQYRPDLGITREIVAHTSIHRKNTVDLKIRNTSDRKVWLKVFDSPPEAFNAVDANPLGSVDADHVLNYSYSITPTERGVFNLNTVTLIIRSRLHLWDQKQTHSVPSKVNVYPDFGVITRYLELAAVEQRAQVGVKLVARRGSGLEFDQLREYRYGDAINHVDWKATSKHQKLISREYQDERDQQICILLDSGMTMQMKSGDMSSFDHALNALILVSFVALRQGDSVGVQIFGQTNKWIPPIKGPKSINVLLNSVFNEDCGPVPSDYVQATETFLARQRKRSMVMLITNTREADNDLPAALGLLSTRHLTVLVNLRDLFVDSILERDIQNFNDALLHSERSHFMKERLEARMKCASQCHHTIDCTPNELLVRLLNIYLSIKRGGAL